MPSRFATVAKCGFATVVVSAVAANVVAGFSFTAKGGGGGGGRNPPRDRTGASASVSSCP